MRFPGEMDGLKFRVTNVSIYDFSFCIASFAHGVGGGSETSGVGGNGSALVQ